MDELPLWGISPPKHIRALTSGLTNRSYMLETGNHKYVLRLNNNNALKLGISRRNELRALTAIAGEDFAPDLVYACPNFSYLLTRHIDGLSFAEKAPNQYEKDMLSHIVEFYQQEIDLNLTPISYLCQLQAYYQTALESNLIDTATADAWEQFQPKLEHFESVLPPLIFCHGDLTPGNIIRHNGRIKIIDWEYACAGHPDIDKLAANLIADTKDQQYSITKEVIDWLARLWLLIIPHYPSLPKEDGRQLEMPPSSFGISE